MGIQDTWNSAKQSLLMLQWISGLSNQIWAVPEEKL
jgi:hypothetical protein